MSERPALTWPCSCGAAAGVLCSGWPLPEGALHHRRLLLGGACPRCGAVPGTPCRDTLDVHPERIVATPADPHDEARELLRLRPWDRIAFLQLVLPWPAAAPGPGPGYRLVERQAACPFCLADLGKPCGKVKHVGGGEIIELLELPHEARWRAFLTLCWPPLRPVLIARCAAEAARQAVRIVGTKPPRRRAGAVHA